MKIDKDLLKHRAEFSRALRNHHYEISEGGIHFQKQGAFASGVYVHDVNGQDERQDSNLVTAEGLAHVLNVAIDGTTSKTGTWYFGLFENNTTPTFGMVGSTWAGSGVLKEHSSNTEGYSETTRQACVEAAAVASGSAASASITNVASKAAFTIIRTSDPAAALTVWGAALCSSSTKGGTSGILLSASRFSAARTLYNTDVFNLAYTLSLTSS